MSFCSKSLIPYYLLLLLVGAPPGYSATSVSFADPVSISPPGTDGAGASEGADFDGDGKIEFISAATRSSSDAHFRLFDFNGTDFDVINLRPDTDIAARRDRFGGDLTPADIDGDGWIDIVVPESSNSNGGGQVSWFENPDGVLTGTWIEHVIDTWSGSGSGQIAHMSEIDVGDIDGDGKLDIVTRDVSHGVFLILQKSDGSGWEPRRFIATNPREGLDLFNPDGDADLDIILNGVWLETPDDPLTGSFQLYTYGAAWYPAGSSSSEISDYASQIAVADFNGDNRDDIAISNSEELANSASTDGKPKGIQIFLAPVDPKTQDWTVVVAETNHFSWHSLEPADLNCDGALDFVSAISTVGQDDAPAEVVYFLNNGDGTAFTKINIVSSSVPFVYNSTIGDADGDGDADLFAPQGFSDGPFRYFENTSPPPSNPPENPPEMLMATALSETAVESTWSDTNTNEAGSKIERKIAGGSYSEVTQVGANLTNWVDTSVAAGTTYLYRVRAFNDAGVTSYSNEVAVTTPTPDEEAPGVPQSVFAAPLSSSKISLSWSPATDNVGVTGYRIYRDSTFEKEVSQLSDEVMGLTAGTAYSFTVTAIDAAGNESAPSSSTSVTTNSMPSLDERLIAYWPLNEEAGATTVSDEIGDRVGSLQGNGISLVSEGKFSGALNLNQSEDRVTVPAFNIGVNQLTLAAWVKPTNFTGVASEARFISKASGSSEQDHDWMVGNNGADGTAVRFRLRTTVGGVDTTTTLTSSDGLLVLNQWAHVAATYDGVMMRLFLNGIEVATEPKTGGVVLSNHPVGLGNQPIGAEDRALGGFLDDIRIYDIALNASELQEVMDVPAPDYDGWISSYLTVEQLSDPELSDPTGDADGNGVLNLVDFSAQQSPLDPDMSVYPGLESMAGNITYYYRRFEGGLPLAGGGYRYGNLVYKVEVCSDLATGLWQSDAMVLQPVGPPVSNGDGTEKFSVRAIGPLGQQERLFFRLRLQLE